MSLEGNKLVEVLIGLQMLLEMKLMRNDLKSMRAKVSWLPGNLRVPWASPAEACSGKYVQ